MVGFHFGMAVRGEDDGVLDQPQRRLGREHVGAAREVLLDDVVLDGAGELRSRRALLVGDGDVERQQPRRRRVDRHRRVHLAERDAVEQRAHVADVRDRHADLADLAARQLVVGVVAGLRRQIEGDGEAGLPLGEVLAVELVGLGGGRVARVGADQPGLVALGASFGLCFSGRQTRFGRLMAAAPRFAHASQAAALACLGCSAKRSFAVAESSAWRGSASGGGRRAPAADLLAQRGQQADER